MQAKTVVLALAGLLVSHQHASAKQCTNPQVSPDDGLLGKPRWRNSLSPCPYGGNCDISTFTHAQRSNYYLKVFARTPQAACTSYVANSNFGQPLTQAQKDSAIAFQVNETTYQCTYDYNKDGHVYGIPGNPTPPNAWNDWSQNHANIDMANLTESMCDRTPNGPYTVPTDPYTKYGVPGKTFTPSMKNYIKGVNNGTKNYWYSDAWMYMPPKAPGGVSEIVDYYSLLYPASGSLVNIFSTVEVDHIIPRTDIYGCACGPNSISNALLISKKLNIELSNNSQHPKRQFLLDTWTTTAAAREIDENVVAEWDAEAIEEDEIGDPESGAELGSCSTGGGVGGFGVVLVGVALGLRRRKVAEG